MQDRTSVTLPDLFASSFLVQEPKVNPNYRAAKIESEAWLAEKCNFTPKMRKKVSDCDFSWFMCIAAPDADAEKLKVVCDWGNWVFPFDDMFDSGPLRSSPHPTRQILTSLLSTLTIPPSPSAFPGLKLPVVAAHDAIYERFAASAFPGTQRRFARAMQDYAAGVAAHVTHFSNERTPSVMEMLETRRLSVGVAPLYCLVEWAHGIRVPESIFEDEVVRELEGLGADFVILSNDILSYRKEESEDCPFNMTAACRLAGQSPQEAFNTLGALLAQRYTEWDLAIALLPSWGAEVDQQVRRYIEGIQNVVQANISWSFRSKRYLGDKADEVRRTRRIDVLTNPSYLEIVGVGGPVTNQ